MKFARTLSVLAIALLVSASISAARAAGVAPEAAPAPAADQFIKAPYVPTHNGKIIRTVPKVTYESRLPENKKCIQENDALNPANMMCARNYEQPFVESKEMTYLVLGILGAFGLWAIFGVGVPRGREFIREANEEYNALSKEMKEAVDEALASERNKPSVRQFNVALKKARKVIKAAKTRDEEARTQPMGLSANY